MKYSNDKIEELRILSDKKSVKLYMTSKENLIMVYIYISNQNRKIYCFQINAIM